MSYSQDNYDLRLALQRGIPFVDALIDYRGVIAASFNVGPLYGLVHVNGCIYAAMPDTFPGIVRKINCVSGAVLAEIVVGNDPRGMCYDGENIWCANYDIGDVGPSNTVSKIDPVTDTVTATITVGKRPSFIEYDGIGRVWVCCSAAKSVYAIDIDTNVATAVPIGFFPHSVAFDNRAYIFFGGTGGLTRVRTTTRIAYRVPTPLRIYGMCSAGSFLWATDFDRRAHRINRLNFSTVPVVCPASPTRRPGYDGKRVWVPCGDSGRTVVVDAESMQVVASISAAGSNRCVCFDDGHAYIAAGDALVKVALF